MPSTTSGIFLSGADRNVQLSIFGSEGSGDVAWTFNRRRVSAGEKNHPGGTVQHVNISSGVSREKLAPPPRRRQGGQSHQSVVPMSMSMPVPMIVSMSPSSVVGAIAAVGRAKGFEKLGGAEGPDLWLLVVLTRRSGDFHGRLIASRTELYAAFEKWNWFLWGWGRKGNGCFVNYR